MKSGAPQPHIVITEAFSPRHLGNWALAECAVRQLRAAFPNARLTILARDPDGVGRITGERGIEKLFPGMPHHANAIRQSLWLLPNALWALASLAAVFISRGNQKKYAALARLFTPPGPRRAALNAIIESNLVVSIAGESINEAFHKKLPFVLYTYWLAACLGKPVVLFPQSFGPLRSPFWRKIAGRALSKCTMVMPRDEESRLLLLDISIPEERCPLVPDVAIGLNAISASAARLILEEVGIKEDDGPLIAVIPSAFSKSHQSHVGCLAGALRSFLGGHPKAKALVLIGNRRGGICHCDDYEYGEQLMRSIGNSRSIISLLDRELSPEEIKGMFAQLDLVISCRLHMAIFSTMAGTPTIALATQPKIREYMRLCGQENRVLAMDRLSEEVVLRSIEETIKSADSIRRQLEESRVRLEPLAASAGMHAHAALYGPRDKVLEDANSV